jgi:hypothetical protein
MRALEVKEGVPPLNTEHIKGLQFGMCAYFRHDAMILQYSTDRCVCQVLERYDLLICLFFHRSHNFFKDSRDIGSNFRKHFSVQSNLIFLEQTNKFAVAESVFSRTSIDANLE